MNFEKELNPQQYEAVTAEDGHILVLAGAGSGKTRVITYRIAWLMGERGVKPWEILAVTFTNKAAREMKDRVDILLRENSDGLWVSTFHALGVRLLRREMGHWGKNAEFVIYDDKDQQKLIRECLKELDLDDKVYPVRGFIDRIEKAQQKLMTVADYGSRAADFISRNTAEVYRLYEEKKRKLNALDFNDLLIQPVRLFSERPDILAKYQERFRHLLVDEYQDTNQAQYSLVKLLSPEEGSLLAVGDDDQSIYRWRGADIRNILEFERDFPQTRIFKLEQNYRSSQNILNAAGGVIDGLWSRHEKKLWTSNPVGEKVVIAEVYDEVEEAKFICNSIKRLLLNNGSLRMMAVFYRTNVQSRAIEDEMMFQGIPYQVVAGQRFYDRQEIKDLLAYLRLAMNPHDDLQLNRIYNMPPRGIGARTMEKIAQAAKARQTSQYVIMSEFLEEVGLSATVQKKLRSFAEMLYQFHQLSSKEGPTELLSQILIYTNYRYMWEAKEKDSAQERLSNIEEFLAVARNFEKSEGDMSISGFLDRMALMSDIDNYDGENERVSMMTLHSAKGLEFPVVFMAGVEEGLLPHERSRKENHQLEEERRLFYVGMTRAKERLFLIHTESRYLQGSRSPCAPSRFLKDIPAEVSDRISPFRSRSYSRQPVAVAPSKGNSCSRHIDYSYSQETSSASYSQEAAGLEYGTRVKHEVFGEGMVTKVEKSGKNLKVTVFFDSVGSKKIHLGFVRLEPV